MISHKIIYVLHFIFILSIVISTLEAKKTHKNTRGARGHASQGGSLAKKMCIKYSNEACSTKRNLLHPVYSASRVVGGKPAAPKQYPHVAAIGYNINLGIYWLCAGSLISINFILTAGHCTEPYVPFLIRLGKLDLPSIMENPTKTSYRISKIIVHPKYSSGVSLYNDIALLKFQGLHKFTDYIRPICLNTLKNIPNQKLIATGWGKTKDGTQSRKLLAVELDLQKDKQCKSKYQHYNRTLSLCVGYLPGGIDTCDGDSGGPLQYSNRRTKCSKTPVYIQVGITSKGYDDCGAPYWPAIYTKVSNYISWIEGHVWK